MTPASGRTTAWKFVWRCQFVRFWKGSPGWGDIQHWCWRPKYRRHHLPYRFCTPGYFPSYRPEVLTQQPPFQSETARKRVFIHNFHPHCTAPFRVCLLLIEMPCLHAPKKKPAAPLPRARNRDVFFCFYETYSTWPRDTPEGKTYRRRLSGWLGKKKHGISDSFRGTFITAAWHQM